MPVATGIVGDLCMAARRVLAARDMPAERCRATALDRTHHLQLVEAHMPAVGLTPSRTMVAENVCNLQSWSSHGRRLWRRRLLLVSPRASAARRAQGIEWALDLGNHSDRHATVAGCRLEPVVSEQRRNQTNIPAALEQMSCEAVAKRMQRDRLAQPRGFRGLLEQPAELTRGQRPMITATWKQPAVFRGNAGVISARPRFPPLPQQNQDLRRQHHVSVLAALRLQDADNLLLTINITHSQPHHLAGPQPATIGEA